MPVCPIREISGSETPNLSVRVRMMLIARSIASASARVVDQLRPALEVEAEDRGLGRDDDARQHEQRQDQQDDEQISAATTHQPRT